MFLHVQKHGFTTSMEILVDRIQSNLLVIRLSVTRFLTCEWRIDSSSEQSPAYGLFPTIRLLPK